MRDLFKAERVKLTAPRPEDAARMVGWYEDAEYLRLVDTDIAFPKTEAELAEGMPPSPTLFQFHVRRMEDDVLLGFAALHSVEWGNQTAVLAVGIGEAAERGKGYGREAMELLLQYGFCELGLYRIGLDVIAYNGAAIGLYQSLGFKEEGRLRACVYRDDERFDRIYMGILRPEWFERQGE